MSGSDAFLMETLLDSLEFKLYNCGVTPLVYPYSEPWHAHPCGCASQITLAGHVSAIRGQAPLVLAPGDALLTPANLTHTHALLEAPEGKATARWALFDFYVTRHVDALSFFELPKVLSGDNADRFGDFSEAMTRSRRATNISRLEAAARIKKIGFAMLEAMFELVPLKKTAADVWDALAKVGPALEFIEKNYAVRTTVRELARKAGMSETRFHASFRRATGTSPAAYLIDRRTRHAQRLLGATDLSVSEVAEKCGFEDPFFFSRTFKNRVGTSPTDYRRLAGEMFSRMVGPEGAS